MTLTVLNGTPWRPWIWKWTESITPELRDKSLFQAKLLAGVLWEALAVLIDQFFEAGAAGLKNACSKTRTAKCSTKTR